MTTTPNKSSLYKRIVLAILCASLGTFGALADHHESQTSPSQSTTSSSQPDSLGASQSTSALGSTTTPGQSSTGAASLHNLTAEKFVQKAILGSVQEVHLGQLAIQKAQNMEVRQFGQRMVLEHSQANQKLVQLAQSKGISIPETNMFASLIGSQAGQTASSSQSQTTPSAGTSSVGGTATPSTSSQTTGSDQDQIGQGAGARNLDQLSSNPSAAGQSSSGTSNIGGTSTPSTSGADQGSSTSSTTSSSQYNAGQSSTAVGSTATSGQTGTTSGQLGASTSTSAGQQSHTDKAELKPFDRQFIQHLQTLSGSQFEQAYMRHLVKDHAEDIQMFEQASRQLQDTELKNFVAQTLPKLRDHYNQARQIARNLGVNAQQLGQPGQPGQQEWQREHINDREGQPRSNNDLNLNR